MVSKMADQTTGIGNSAFDDDLCCRMYEKVTKFGPTHLENSSLESILKKMPEILSSKSFLALSNMALCKILSNDNIRVQNELQIFKLAMRIGHHKCIAADVESTPENLRTILKDVIPLVRFPKMTEQDYLDYVQPQNILDEEQLDSMKKYWLRCHACGKPPLVDDTVSNLKSRFYLSPENENICSTTSRFVEAMKTLEDFTPSGLHSGNVNIVQLDYILSHIQKYTLHLSQQLESTEIKLTDQIQATETHFKSELHQLSLKFKNTKSELQRTKEELEDTKSDLKSTKSLLQETISDLDRTKRQLREAKADILDTKNELRVTNTLLAGVEANLKKTNDSLQETISDLDGTKRQLREAKADIVDTKNELRTTNNLLARTEANLKRTDETLEKTRTELQGTIRHLEETNTKLDRTNTELTIFKREWESGIFKQDETNNMMNQRLIQEEKRSDDIRLHMEGNNSKTELKLHNLTMETKTSREKLHEVVLNCQAVENKMEDSRMRDAATVIPYLIPVGFIYIQYPKEDGPKQLWPHIEWMDVTEVYAGLFFRALGGNSCPYGMIQMQEVPRINMVSTRTTRFQPKIETTNLPEIEGTSGCYVFTGNATKSGACTGNSWGMQFHIKGVEVRPQNMAIKIWKRINVLEEEEKRE